MSTKMLNILSKLSSNKIYEGQNSLDLDSYLTAKLGSSGYKRRGSTWTYFKISPHGPILTIKWTVDERKSKDEGVNLIFGIGIDGHPLFKDWEYETGNLLSKSEIDIAFEQATRSFGELFKDLVF